jgi:hypothetical protein
MDATTRRSSAARGEIKLPAVPEEVAPTAQPAAAPAAVHSASTDISDFGDEVLAAMTESQTALVRGIEAANREMSALTRLGIDIAARNATDLTAARTWPDAVNAGTELARAGLDAIAESALKFAEIGLRLTLDLAKPISNRLSRA